MQYLLLNFGENINKWIKILSCTIFKIWSWNQALFPLRSSDFLYFVIWNNRSANPWKIWHKIISLWQKWKRVQSFFRLIFATNCLWKILSSMWLLSILLKRHQQSCEVEQVDINAKWECSLLEDSHLFICYKCMEDRNFKEPSYLILSYGNLGKVWTRGPI